MRTVTEQAIATAISPNEIPVYELLERLGINYTLTRHEAFLTCDDVEKSDLDFPGLHIKNLFVRDTRADQYYLVLLLWTERLDIKGYRDVTGWSRRIAFCGDDELMEYLGVETGACSVFGLLNDKEHAVTLVVGRSIAAAPDSEPINFHPNDNRATVTMTVGDMRRVIEAMGCRVIYDDAADDAAAEALPADA